MFAISQCMRVSIAKKRPTETEVLGLIYGEKITRKKKTIWMSSTVQEERADHLHYSYEIGV